MIRLAQREGFEVEFMPLDGYAGLLLSNRLILVDSQMPQWRQREAIAHELGHGFYGHQQGIEHEDPVLEQQADLYAALLLISPTEYALAESLCEHPGAIAKELGVSVRLVNLWRQTRKSKALALR